LELRPVTTAGLSHCLLVLQVFAYRQRLLLGQSEAWAIAVLPVVD
jgi:hypothetical protein